MKIQTFITSGFDLYDAQASIDDYIEKYNILAEDVLSIQQSTCYTPGGNLTITIMLVYKVNP